LKLDIVGWWHDSERLERYLPFRIPYGEPIIVQSRWPA